MAKSLISPSSIKTFLECQRKWAFRKIDNLTIDTNTTATAKGSATHKVLEDYLEGKKHPKANPNDPWAPESLAALAVDSGHLPKPGQALVEGKFVTRDGYTGFKDFTVKHDDRTLEDFNRFGGRPRRGRVNLVGDHKTSSDPGAWGLSPHQLELSDAQGLIYAYDEFQKDQTITHVDLFWSYMQSKKKVQYLPVFARVERETNHQQMKKLHVIRDEMQDLMDGGCKTAHDLPKSLDACSSYGGCPYVQVCFTAEEMFDDFELPKSFQTEKE